MNKKLCVVTSSRADYGLIRPLLEKIDSDDKVSLDLIVTGSHLSPEFGMTVNEIINDGFNITEEIETLLSSDTIEGVCKSMGLGLISYSEAIKKINPDMVIVLGDRYEILAMVIAAHVCRIPVAHISGGEVTEGAIDDSFRHSITKMSQLHFTATEVYRKRVIQLGENPNNVFNVGEIGLENIRNFKLLSKSELEKNLNFKFGELNLLITYHPVTLENNTSRSQINDLLAELDNLRNTFLIFTKSNADANGKIINNIIEQYVLTHPGKSVSFESLGRLRYLSIMKNVDGVVGNSSSGIVEAPSLKIGTLNIGDRQKGRVRAKSVIDCNPNKPSIRLGLKELVSLGFKNKLKDIGNPYEKANGTDTIFKTILKFLKNNSGMKKIFYDI